MKMQMEINFGIKMEKADNCSVINISYSLTGYIRKQLVGLIGENGLKANVFYKEHNGQFVEYES
jgi:hypothetical protein